MRARRSLVLVIVAAMALPYGGVATARPTPPAAEAGPPLARDRCREAGGEWSQDRGTRRCITTFEQVEERRQTDASDDVVLSKPDGGLRATVRTTTVVTTRTTTVIRRTESQRGTIGAPGTADTYRSTDEVVRTSTEVDDTQVTVALAACERRVGADAWEPAPSTDCRATFGDAVGPAPPHLDPDTAARCEFLDPTECLLAWPSDHFTVADPTTDTGRRLALDRMSMPRNVDGVAIDPTELNRSDGFSPGTMIVTRVPGIDLATTGAPPLGDLAQSLAPDAPLVVVDADTGERHPFWAELDDDATTDEDRALMLRPAVNFEEGHRYVVAMRRLKDAAGDTIPANPVFATYRDAIPTDVAHVEARRPAMESIFATLADAGVARHDLHLAWDFTVASERNLSERLLHLRDDAFGDLGAAAPSFTVTGIEDLTPEQDAQIARRVEGTFEVPLYLTGAGAPGSTFHWGGDGLPERNGSITANFSCRVPRAATGETPARISLYGHGLLGSRGEVNAGNVRAFADEHGIVFCATDWIGMANADIGTVVGILQDMSNFPQLADRVQQGILNTLFLGRLMKHDEGLAAHPAFRDDGVPLIDTTELFYDGNSQGGIIGGAATAVAQDWTRAVLGVPGMNYSLLLRRSSDWPVYASIFEVAYPDRLDQTLTLAMIQSQWDRAEANGYAHHLTGDPYPGTPEHQVLLHVAYADFQVTMWSAEIMARTIGAHLRQPALAPGRHPDEAPYFGLPPVPGDGFGGSVMVYWDSGTPPPPSIEEPPSEGTDPHSRPRAQASARLQKSLFFDGAFVDVCGAEPCLAP
jgi:hypothetical protein